MKRKKTRRYISGMLVAVLLFLLCVVQNVNAEDVPAGSELPRLVDDADILTAVSYTHLDVYKRQVPGMGDNNFRKISGCSCNDRSNCVKFNPSKSKEKRGEIILI